MGSRDDAGTPVRRRKRQTSLRRGERAIPRGVRRRTRHARPLNGGTPTSTMIRFASPPSRAAIVLAVGGLIALASRADDRPDLVLVNGRVFTADPRTPSAEGVVIRGDRIVAVGSSAEVERLAGAGAQRIDLQGRLVVPGFNDAHAHFDPDPKGVRLLFSALEPRWEEASAAIRQAGGGAPAGTWIFGVVGREIVLDSKVTRFALDRIAPDHPVLLRAYYGHGYVVSSKAMASLAISEDEPDPSG